MEAEVMKEVKAEVMKEVKVEGEGEMRGQEEEAAVVAAVVTPVELE